ncbi:type II secretion system F family protein [Paenibacillus sp. GCM10027627]|uniref:type II secretion system F family protein n=1 Tax=unclassified Paenibacillus TaxID=185978 RepID=UPI00362B14D3
MDNSLVFTAGGVLLFILLYGLMYGILLFLNGRNQLKSRLTYKSGIGIRESLIRFKWIALLREHVGQLLETLRMRTSPDFFLLLSLLLGLSGLFVGGLFFQTTKGAFVFGLVIGLAPYVWLRGLLVHRRMGAQMDFLPAVELFYQCYLVTGEGQVRIALQGTVEEKRLLGPMQSVFEQLYRNLCVRGDDDASLKIMASSLGHIWADYFAGIMKVALTEGVSITESLRELLSDMRKSRRANERERHRLLEIRVANFTPVLFLALFIGINLRYNRTNSFYYYVHDSEGRDMLLNALLLIFGSFLMGLWLSRKKM